MAVVFNHDKRVHNVLSVRLIPGQNIVPLWQLTRLRKHGDFSKLLTQGTFVIRETRKPKNSKKLRKPRRSKSKKAER